jgi:hypothetical protein
MAIHNELRYEDTENLLLDPMNPRLGRNVTALDVPQSEVLESMSAWTLDELAVSFLEGGGFWTHEALLVTEEILYGKPSLVVVEGNRRLAALKLLRQAFQTPEESSKKWLGIAAGGTAADNLFTKVPYIYVDSRKEIEAFLGFRHVTGIKEWRPAEKAEYIARLVDGGLSYKQVMRKIGSKTPAVRQNYISYRLLLQMEDTVEDLAVEKVQERFSVMYIALKTEGGKKYLSIDILAEPNEAKRPVPDTHLRSLAHFSEWLFGTKVKPPLFTDSRRVNDFGRILESPIAVKYLEESSDPRFDVALQRAGGDEPELLRLLGDAGDSIELALMKAHLYKNSKEIQEAVERVGRDSAQLLQIFPVVREKLASER